MVETNLVKHRGIKSAGDTEQIPIKSLPTIIDEQNAVAPDTGATTTIVDAIDISSYRKITFAVACDKANTLMIVFLTDAENPVYMEIAVEPSMSLSKYVFDVLGKKLTITINDHTSADITFSSSLIGHKT